MEPIGGVWSHNISVYMGVLGYNYSSYNSYIVGLAFLVEKWDARYDELVEVGQRHGNEKVDQKF